MKPLERVQFYHRSMLPPEPTRAWTRRGRLFVLACSVLAVLLAALSLITFTLCRP